MEVDAKVLAAMNTGAEALYGAISALGKKIDPAFRPATLHKRDQVVEGIGGAFEASQLTLEEMSKAVDLFLEKNAAKVAELTAKVDSTAKEAAEVSAFAEDTLTKFEKLSKGYKACPDCGMSGKLAKGEVCGKCEGQGFFKIK